MWIRRNTQPPPPQAAPVVKKTPEQLAEERAADKVQWEERNPLRKFRVVFVGGEEKIVSAHFTTGADGGAHNGRILFFRKRYGMHSVYRPDLELREIVFWAASYSVRFVEMIEE